MARWPAAFMASAWAVRFSAKACFRAKPMRPKTALVHLVARLKLGGYRLLDAQFTTEHLERFGAVGVPRRSYKQMLVKAIDTDGDFFALPEGLPGDQLLQSITQTS
jgi:leucyl/phenylalanyl-tRNA--protein transferase